MAWRVAYALNDLLAEINRAAPSRSKVSDGSIGDAAHASRSSDHNPWVQRGGQGIVRARDFTHDPAGGMDAGVLAHRLQQLGASGDARLQGGGYVIWKRRSCSAKSGWEWRAYSGSNPHTAHVHVSVSQIPDAFDRRGSWGVADKPLVNTPDIPDSPKEDDAMTPEQERKLDDLARKVDALQKANPLRIVKIEGGDGIFLANYEVSSIKHLKTHDDIAHYRDVLGVQALTGPQPRHRFVGFRNVDTDQVLTEADLQAIVEAATRKADA